MPVSITHPEYDYSLGQWRRTSDTLEGTDAIKASAETYLPMLEGHKADPDSYARYVNGALFYGAARRVLDSFVSSIYRKDPQVTVPARMKPRLDNINGAGDNFYTFSKRIVHRNLGWGRVGLLVEAPAPNENGSPAINDSTDPAANLPWIAAYEAADIRCWRTKVRGGKTIVDQVILGEHVEVPADDEFGFKMEKRYRVLDLDDNDLYRIRIYRQTDTGQDELIAQYEPKPKGQRINYIPFIFIGPTDLRPGVTRSPLLDLVDCNLSWFKSSAEVESAREKIAWPVMWATTSDPGEQTIDLQTGGNNILWLETGNSLNIAEFTGDGIGALERAMAQKEGYMAALGARMLEEPKKAAEAAETQYLKKSSEHSILASVAMTTSDGLTAALKIACEWVAASGEVKAELNTDFFDAPISPQTIAALGDRIDSGHYLLEDFIFVMMQGEMTRPGMSVEEIMAALETRKPILLGTPENLNDPNAPPTNQPQPAQKSGATPSTPNVPDSRTPAKATPRRPT